MKVAKKMVPVYIWSGEFAGPRGEWVQGPKFLLFLRKSRK